MCGTTDPVPGAGNFEAGPKSRDYDDTCLRACRLAPQGYDYKWAVRYCWTPHSCLVLPLPTSRPGNFGAVPLPFLPSHSYLRDPRRSICRPSVGVLLCMAFVFCLPILPSASADEEKLARGEAIWRASCVDCHGENGEGVAGAYELPLIGDDTAGQLAAVIGRTMPKDDPELCRGEDAQAVAEWIHHSFYSEAARLRKQPPRRRLTHLTANQIRQSLADLYGQARGSMWRENKRGLNANYFDGARWKKENLRIERVDPFLNFDWKKDSPGEGVSAEAFYVHWRGGLKINESGRYELVLRSSAAFRMQFGHFDRLLIDNHVQSGDKTEFRRSVYLLAGRVYPLQIELYQRERKTEQPPVRISLAWVPPHGVEQVIPTRHLVAASPPATFALQTKLAPDDRSYGFARGLNIDRTWDEAITRAAAEFSGVAVEELWADYRRRNRNETDENRARLRAFLTSLAETAFRGPLQESERKFYIDEQVDAVPDDAFAIRRSLLTILRSPRFLYPDLDQDRTVSQKAASRLALTLFDSLPADESLRKAVGNDQLQSEEQVREMARRMVRDYRCEGKTREMLHEWLNLNHIAAIEKSKEQFPEFATEIVADLRVSLDATLEAALLEDESDYRRLFSSPWNYSTSHLADYYGDVWQLSDDTVAAGEDFQGLVPIDTLRRVSAQAPFNHGILTHPYLMSGLAYPDTTSPIHRGVFLIRYLLGRTLQPPQEAFTPFSAQLHPDLTTRERVILQTGSNTCQVCHSKINELGFTLENFDAVGRFRQTEFGKPIDSKGSYTNRTGEKIVFAGAEDLANYLATSDDAHRAFIQRAFQHFVKQPVAAYGTGAMDSLVQSFKSSGYNLRDLLVEIAVMSVRPVLENSQQNTQNEKALQ